jgi:hypothetical protein
LGRAQQAHVSAPHLPSWFPVADTAGLFVRVTFLLKSSHRRFPSLSMTNPVSKSFLSLLGAPSGYISKCATPRHLHPALSKLL